MAIFRPKRALTPLRSLVVWAGFQQRMPISTQSPTNCSLRPQSCRSLYSCYHLRAGDFFRITGPVWGLSLALCLLLCLALPRAALHAELKETPAPDRGKLGLYLGLFAVCLAGVFRLLPWPVMLGIVAAALLIFDRRALLGADFLLLLTFVAFFIFAGNLARLEAVDRLLRQLLLGREYLTALLASQVISNVPAALLLSGFTDNARELLLGVDVGGLGTPIASLASLISLKLYSRSEGARTSGCRRSHPACGRCPSAWRPPAPPWG